MHKFANLSLDSLFCHHLLTVVSIRPSLNIIVRTVLAEKGRRRRKIIYELQQGNVKREKMDEERIIMNPDDLREEQST
jgi:hypothetical protein